MAHTHRRSRRRHLIIPLVMLLVLLLIGGGTYLALTQFGDLVRSGRCTAAGLGTTHRYNTERTANAALIGATAVDRGLPPRAASIALATAYQESKLENIEHGDRDSLGLFQQRPSQDWGTEEEIMDPVYATNAFYDALEDLDYESMSVNDAAQEVQLSGHPEAYGDHETEGRLFASALTGQSGGNLVCDLDAPEAPGSPQRTQEELERQFPRHTGSGSISADLSPAADTGLELPDGVGATALVIDPDGDDELGWALANWAVARAADDGVVHVAYAGQFWDRTTRDPQAGSWDSSETDTDTVVVLFSGG